MYLLHRKQNRNLQESYGSLAILSHNKGKTKELADGVVITPSHNPPDNHLWLADEPIAAGGTDLGPDPYEHLLAALGTCTSMTIRMYANFKKLPLDDVTVTLSHDRQHITDCEGCEETPQKIEVINRTVSLTGDLSEENRQRLLEIADRCPVHQTLYSELKIQTGLA